MSIINITVEGQTEQRFCHHVLGPYLFAQSGHIVIATPVTTNNKRGTKGGAVNWDKFRHHVQTWQRQTPGQIHTMMFDLYGLSTSFPGYHDSIKLSGAERASKIEEKIRGEIGHQLFHPYIQVYEFEALLFSDPDHIQARLGKPNKSIIPNLQDLTQQFETPEHINDGPETAPSKRLLTYYPTYRKVDDGIVIAQAISIEIMRHKCTRFNHWIQLLLNLP
jgi:hypothetical protein